MAERRRVAITGIGVVSPIGSGPDALWDGLRREQSAVATVTRWDPAMWRSQVAAHVDPRRQKIRQQDDTLGPQLDTLHAAGLNVRLGQFQK